MISIFGKKMTINLKGCLIIVAGLLLAVVSTLTVTPSQPASAAGCRYYNTSTPAYNMTTPEDDYGWWTYGAHKTVPSSSGCRDINVVRGSIHSMEGYIACANFRIRYLSSWKTTDPVLACTGYGSVVIKANVSNGTSYRVETDQPVTFQIFD